MSAEPLSCRNCKGTPVDPVRWPCGHVFCLECSRLLCSWKNAGNLVALAVDESHPESYEVACTVCKAKHVCKAGEELDRIDAELAEAVKAKEKLKALCDVCDKPAEFSCAVCRENLCEGCFAERHKGKKSAHEKGELSDAPTESKNCATHPGHPIALYCKQCKLPICAVCEHSTHEGHGSVLLDKLEAELRQAATAALAAERKSAMALGDSALALHGKLAVFTEVRAHRIATGLCGTSMRLTLQRARLSIGAARQWGSLCAREPRM